MFPKDVGQLPRTHVFVVLKPSLEEIFNTSNIGLGLYFQICVEGIEKKIQFQLSFIVISTCYKCLHISEILLPINQPCVLCCFSPPPPLEITFVASTRFQVDLGFSMKFREKKNFICAFLLLVDPMVKMA